MLDVSASRQSDGCLTAPHGTTSPARVVVLGFVVVVTWVLLRSGPGLPPGVEVHEAMAREWPRTEVSPATAYMLRVPLGQALYNLVPEPGLARFVLLHGVALLVAGCLLLVWLLRRYGSQTGAIAATVLLLSPLTAVLLEWIGIYDAFSLLAWVLLVLTLASRRSLQLAAAALAGTQNFEQVAVGLVLLALLPEVGRAVGWRPWFPGLLAGAVLGRAALESYLWSVGAPSGSRLTYLLHDPDVLGDVVQSSLAHAPLLVVTALGGLWAFAVPEVRRSWSSWPVALRVRLVVAAVLVLGVGTLTWDHTRVMVLSALPLTVAGAVLIGRESATYGDFWRRSEAWLLLLFPPVISFGEEILPLGVTPGSWGIGPW